MLSRILHLLTRTGATPGICPASLRDVDDRLTGVLRSAATESAGANAALLERLHVTQPTLDAVSIDTERGSVLFRLDGAAVRIATADLEAAGQLRAAARLTTMRLRVATTCPDAAALLAFEGSPWTYQVVATAIVAT